MRFFFWKRENPLHTYAAIAIALLFIFTILFLNVQNPLTFATIKKIYTTLSTLQNQGPILFTLVLFAIYVLSICLVIPDSILLSLLAGIVFPLPFAVFFISFSEMVGALCFFCILQNGFKAKLQKKTDAIVHGPIGRGFVEHEIHYLLFLRISHLIPFWLVNVLALVFKTHLLRFMWTTFIGTLPLSWVLATAGKTLKVAMEADGSFSIREVLNRQTEMALVALGLLILLPIAVKKIKK